LITAYLTVTLLVIYYFCYFDSNLDPFRTSGDDETFIEHPNPVDRVVLLTLRKKLLSSKWKTRARVLSFFPWAGLEVALNKVDYQHR